MKSDEIQKLWEDPKSWKHFYYYCPEDPRVIVPKRKLWGWTINFAHRLAWVHLVASVVLTPLTAIILCYIIYRVQGATYPTVFSVVSGLVLTITMLCLLGVYQSS